jgi:hypothetical protein
VICRCSAANASGQRVMRTEGKQDVDREEESLNAAASGLGRTGFPDHPNTVGHRDLLYLFACHVEWSHRQSLGAHQELVAALDDSDQAIRAMAEIMLHRYSPRPRKERRGTIFQM